MRHKIKETVKCGMCGSFVFAEKTDDVWIVYVGPVGQTATIAVICDTCALTKFPDERGCLPRRMAFGMLKKEEGLIWLPKSSIMN